MLSDRHSTAERAPIPSLLLTSAVHQHLVRQKSRTKVALVVESGDAREVHHVALLLGYGAGAVNPYLVLESAEDLARHGLLGDVTPAKAIKNTVYALGKGVLKVMSKMGISTVGSYRAAQVFAVFGIDQDGARRVLHRQHHPHRRQRAGDHRRRRGDPARAGLRAQPAHPGAPRPGDRRPVPVAPRGRDPPVQPGDRLPAAALHPEQAADGLPPVHRRRRQAVPRGRHAARAVRAAHRRAAGRSAGRGRAGVGDRQAVRHRRDVLRVDLHRGAPDAGHRDEPARRQVEHRRGRRGRRPAARPGPPVGDQAGRVRPVRGDQRVPGERRGDPDQDGAGRQARRGRPAARQQGLPVDRRDPARHRGCRADLAAAAPRHLLHRGSQAADPRPAQRQPGGRRVGQAGVGARRRHGRGRRHQGARRQGDRRRQRRRHRRGAAHLAQAHRPALGARPGRDAADAAAQPAARAGQGAGRRRAEDRRAT